MKERQGSLFFHAMRLLGLQPKASRRGRGGDGEGVGAGGGLGAGSVDRGRARRRRGRGPRDGSSSAQLDNCRRRYKHVTG